MKQWTLTRIIFSFFTTGLLLFASIQASATESVQQNWVKLAVMVDASQCKNFEDVMKSTFNLFDVKEKLP
jgi:hypothetical protein